MEPPNNSNHNITFARAAFPTIENENRAKTLNEDPFNVRAEELAVHDCQRGFVVEKELAETELVVTSCGCLIQGTPDGGFIDSDGLLRLVQVVRVPLLDDMSADEVGEVLFDTVLAKIVKSQIWMKETRTLPHDFTIFCWLPPRGAYEECLRETDAFLWTEALMWNVRKGGWPFSLRVKVPDQADLIFPTSFGQRNQNRINKDYFDKLCFSLDPTMFDDLDEDEELIQWYLFENDFDMQDETEHASVAASSDLIAWVALAIQFIKAKVDGDDLFIQHVLDTLIVEDQAKASFRFFSMDGKNWVIPCMFPGAADCHAYCASSREPVLPPSIQGYRAVGGDGKEPSDASIHDRPCCSRGTLFSVAWLGSSFLIADLACTGLFSSCCCLATDLGNSDKEFPDTSIYGRPWWGTMFTDVPLFENLSSSGKPPLAPVMRQVMDEEAMSKGLRQPRCKAVPSWEHRASHSFNHRFVAVPVAAQIACR